MTRQMILEYASLRAVCMQADARFFSLWGLTSKSDSGIDRSLASLQPALPGNCLPIALSVLDNAELIQGLLSLFALLGSLVLLSAYIWFTLLDILVVMRNYNFTRADFCNWRYCGLYCHDENDPESRECLSPRVSRSYFDKVSRGGKQHGCRYSIKVREIELERKPAADYLEEYLAVHRAFNTSTALWKVVTILGAIAFWALGFLSVNETLELLF